jgi:hypothetical protein
MKRNTHILLYVLISLSVSANSAEEVYTWVDASGTTHFSETLPPEPATRAQLIEVLPASGAAPANVVDDGFYSVINQAERMQKRRLENEKLAAEKRQADAEASKARAEAQAALQNPYYNEPDTWYPVYPYYPRYGHRRPGYGNKPGHGNRPGHGSKPGYGNRPGHSRPGKSRALIGKTPGMPHF